MQSGPRLRRARPGKTEDRMNGRQRIACALRGEWPDARPVMLHNFMSAAAEAGLRMAEYRRSAAAVARAHIRAAETYDLDGVLIDFDTCTLAGALGAAVAFPEDAPARVRAPALASLEEVRDLGPPAIAGDGRVQLWLEACREVKAYFGDEKFVRGNCDQAPFALASMLRGLAPWLLDLMDPAREPLARRLLEYCAEAGEAFVSLMAATGVDMVSNGDSPAGPEVIAPEMYRAFALPYEARIAARAHALGLPHMLHICGDTTRILRDMRSSGTDALELDFKTDVRAIHAECSRSVVLSGTIDPVGVLERGAPDAVAAAVRAILDVYEDSPRLIVNAGCALPAATPAENIRALVRAARGA